MNESAGKQATNEIERNAYNAAFYELGFKWHWDADTYDRLLKGSQVAGDRIRVYLETAQSHLLKAYDAEFLVNAIESKKLRQPKTEATAGKPASRHFNWACMQGECGA